MREHKNQEQAVRKISKEKIVGQKISVTLSILLSIILKKAKGNRRGIKNNFKS